MQDKYGTHYIIFQSPYLHSEWSFFKWNPVHFCIWDVSLVSYLLLASLFYIIFAPSSPRKYQEILLIFSHILKTKSLWGAVKKLWKIEFWPYIPRPKLSSVFIFHHISPSYFPIPPCHLYQQPASMTDIPPALFRHYGLQYSYYRVITNIILLPFNCQFLFRWSFLILIVIVVPFFCLKCTFHSSFLLCLDIIL